MAEPAVWWYLLPFFYCWEPSGLNGWLFISVGLPLNGIVTGLLLGSALPKQMPRPYLLGIMLIVTLILVVETWCMGSFQFVRKSITD